MAALVKLAAFLFQTADCNEPGQAVRRVMHARGTHPFEGAFLAMLATKVGAISKRAVHGTTHRRVEGGSSDKTSLEALFCDRAMHEATATRLVLPTWDVYLIKENAGQIQRASWLCGCLGRRLGSGQGGRGIRCTCSDDLQG